MGDPRIDGTPLETRTGLIFQEANGLDDIDKFRIILISNACSALCAKLEHQSMIDLFSSFYQIPRELIFRFRCYRRDIVLSFFVCHCC